MSYLLQTERLILRPVRHDDEPALSAVLGDGETMRWYPQAYTREEVHEWIERQMDRYVSGAGFLGLVNKRSGELIGDCGAAWQDINGKWEVEIGYHVHRSHWNRGFATEAARAVMDHVFRNLGVDRVISMIRPENLPSRRVAEKNGLRVERVVFWRDYDHCVYGRSKSLSQ